MYIYNGPLGIISILTSSFNDMMIITFNMSVLVGILCSMYSLWSAVLLSSGYTVVYAIPFWEVMPVLLTRQSFPMRSLKIRRSISSCCEQKYPLV